MPSVRRGGRTLSGRCPAVPLPPQVRWLLSSRRAGCSAMPGAAPSHGSAPGSRLFPLCRRTIPVPPCARRSSLLELGGLAVVVPAHHTDEQCVLTRSHRGAQRWRWAAPAPLPAELGCPALASREGWMVLKSTRMESPATAPSCFTSLTHLIHEL